MTAFRRGYERLFAEFREVRATVTDRLVSGRHVVEHEHWSRVTPAGEREEGELLVRYTEQDGLIAVVEFLR